MPRVVYLDKITKLIYENKTLGVKHRMVKN